MDGIKGFYRGYWASLSAYVPNSALWWGFYHFYQGIFFILFVFYAEIMFCYYTNFGYYFCILHCLELL